MDPYGSLDAPAHLTLCHLNSSVLSLIGKYCPKLVTLEINGIDIKKKDIVALILGDLVDILLPTSAEGEKWSKDAVLESLRVPAELLTPLCFSLSKLILRTDPPLRVSTLAFALRHLKALEEMDVGKEEWLPDDYYIVKAIGLLYYSQHSVDRQIQQEFDDICCEAVSHVSFERNLLTSPTLHSGGLLLRSVNFGNFDFFVTICRLLQAVVFSCSQLNEIIFFGHSLWNSNDHLISKTEKEIESLLNNWPKSPKVQRIEFINFNCSSAAIMGSIVRAFSPTLKELYISCETMEMDSLADCHNLEHLHIYFSNVTQNLRGEPSSWSAETFLPSLKGLWTNVCLGIWSPLFEGKSTLTHLKLKCCHIETNIRNSELVWTKMPEFWPRLESLELERCTGLSMATAAEVFPQMDSLRCIKLPKSMMSKDPQLTSKVVKDLASRKRSVHLSSSDSAEEPCPYQPI